MTDSFIEALEAELRAAQQRRIRLLLAPLPVPGGVLIGAVLSFVVVVAIGLVVLQARHAGTTAPASAPTDTPPSARAALGRAASAAARGSLAPRLDRGQAWYVEADEYTALNPGVYDTPVVQKWFSQSEERGRRGTSGWQGESAGALGFSDWDPALNAPQAQELPTSPTALRALLGRRSLASGYVPYDQPNGEVTPDTAHGAFTQLAQLATLLAEMPLRPATRTAAWQVIAQLPGLRYLGNARTEVGRAGVAVAEVSPPVRELPEGGPGQPPRRYEFELIFNPNTGRVLGFETRTLALIGALKLKAGSVVFAWSAREVGVAPTQRVNALIDHQRQASAQLRRPGEPCATSAAGKTRPRAAASPPCRAAERALEGNLTRSLRSLATPL